MVISPGTETYPYPMTETLYTFSPILLGALGTLSIWLRSQVVKLSRGKETQVKQMNQVKEVSGTISEDIKFSLQPLRR